MLFPLLFARARLFAVMAAIAATAEAAPPAAPAPEAEPTYYSCSVTRTGTFGTVWYWLDVPVDGSAPYHHIQWQNPNRAEGLRLLVRSDGPGPVDGRLNRFASFAATFLTSRPVTRDARIEIRRGPGQHNAFGFAYAGPYQRPSPWLDSGLHAVQTEGRWDELNVWMSGRESLIFALVRRDGSVVAEDRLDAATIAAATGAVTDAHRKRMSWPPTIGIGARCPGPSSSPEPTNRHRGSSRLASP